MRITSRQMLFKVMTISIRIRGQILGIEKKNIIVFSRSMWRSTATNFACLRKPGSLLLMTNFKSITAISQDLTSSVIWSILYRIDSKISRIFAIFKPQIFIVRHERFYNCFQVFLRPPWQLQRFMRFDPFNKDEPQ